MDAKGLDSMLNPIITQSTQSVEGLSLKYILVGPICTLPTFCATLEEIWRNVVVEVNRRVTSLTGMKTYHFPLIVVVREMRVSNVCFLVVQDLGVM